MNSTSIMDANIEELNPVHLDLTNSLENLPVEIILHICSFLDAKLISNSLSNVCQRFRDIFNDEYFWKSRIVQMHKHMVAYPALPVIDPDFDWLQNCVDIEREQLLWKNKEESKIKHLVWRDVHYAAVDAIRLLNHGQVCATGGRDRSIVIWNLSGASDNDGGIPPFEMNAKAHKGWIWNFISNKDTLYSCSWDTFIKAWSIGNGLQGTGSIKCENAVLSLAAEGSVIAAGLYNSRVLMFDPRASDVALNSYNRQRRAILALAMDDTYIISASEDQTLAVWDRKAGKIFKEKIRLVNKSVVNQNLQGMEIGNAFPMCMSYKNNILYVGDSKGKLHLVNPDMGKFQVVKSYDVGHRGQITSVDQGHGYIMTSSTDGTVRILSPTNPPQLLTVLNTAGGEVTGLSYENDVLATGGTNCAVELWIPNSSS